VPDNTFQIKSYSLIKPFFPVREASAVAVRSSRFSDCPWGRNSSQLAYLNSGFRGCVIVSERREVRVLRLKKLSSRTSPRQARALRDAGERDWIWAEIVLYPV